jgi:hypothetical protein
MREAGFSQVMLAARDLVGHPDGLDAAVQAVKASGLRVTGFQVLRDFEGCRATCTTTRSTSPSPCWRCARAGLRLLLACSSTSVHATQDLDAMARDLRKLAMLAMPLGIKVAYEGLSWGRTINEFTAAWDVISRADVPNLGLGLDSFHMFATETPLDDLELLDPARSSWCSWPTSCGTRSSRWRSASPRRAFPGVSGRRRAQRGAGRPGARLHALGYRGRLQLRGLQRRLPADAAADRWRSAPAARRCGWARTCCAARCRCPTRCGCARAPPPGSHRLPSALSHRISKETR